MKRQRKMNALFITLACYTAGFFLLFLSHVAAFGYNRALHATGALQQVTLWAEDIEEAFDMHDLVPVDGGYVTTYDAQLSLKDTAFRADGILIEFDYEREPMTVVAFWAKEGGGHTVHKMAYAEQQGTALIFRLPAGGGQSLRIDPDSALGNSFVIRRIVLNPTRGFLSFMRPSAGEWFCLVTLPGLAACLWWQGRRFMRLGAAKRKGGGNDG